ncbi:hypothetical protein BCIN_05g06490 [Botrytis cinerea B05.10]|uniref:SnoaL-like domain-containing protein n=3 Tax=Botryotinia fuckeliana TaxID=40559 RepID=A0A384JIK4_BOTFB|nr:hypothetical protein BCIN_05g06490 [Botrytis cinerea B05.10]ATZ50281.1 hypothetical protein BCIN_05g06490 [Botrytis cinerea B05.10]EMR80511.1 hypothetical protein BcDW1_10891 [Botrytis cinerea BcDW1]CCD53427.1 hypothetical protein BofuT4_P134720.1 [Botrytis cinerea T4]
MSPHNKHSLHVQHKKHGDHDHIMKRMDAYIKEYKKGDTEAIMKFYHPTNFVYSDFSTPNNQLMGLSEVASHYSQTFSNFYDLTITTASVHGHKDFTAWEWEITCRPAISPETGERLPKEKTEMKKLVGCTLMWWEDEKIVRNHDYVQVKDV